jgi:frataxin-like iron-binding protein CyaY
MSWDISYEEQEYFKLIINEDRYALTINQKNRDSFEKTHNVKLEDVLKDIREENYTEAADALREALWAALSDAILNSYDRQVESLLKSSIEEALEHTHKKASLDYDFEKNLIIFKIPNEYVLDNLKESHFFNSYYNDWVNIDYNENIDELLLDELSSHFYFNNDAINSADLTDDEFNDALSSHI